MDTMECLECELLRAAYRRATRNELDLKLQLDEAEIMNDSARLQELRALLGAVGVARASAGQSVLDHEGSHIARWKPHQKDERTSPAHFG
jgi:hypothetical protein